MFSSPVGTASDEFFEGIKQLQFVYQSDSKESKWPGNPYVDRAGWMSHRLDKCRKIVGIKAKTDDPSGVITRIDFLIGNGKVYKSGC